ncbi:MAG: ribose transport system permease protein [Spirochaetes bacterium]|nr:MAG: ribose transport system permease protein [Spirochaetota bacterium]
MKTLQRDEVSKLFARYGVFGVLFVITVAMSLANKSFLTVPNLINVARQVSINTIIAAGMTFIIITSGIDLSVGSLVALSSCVAMIVIEATGSSLLGICTGVVVGGVAGSLNGAFVAWAGIPPFIVTLAGLTIYRGIALIITGGTPIIRFEGGFRFQGAFFGVPVPVIIMAVVVVFMQFLLTRTAFGTHVYSVGGNEEASRLSGIKVGWVKFKVYVMGGMLTALAGMVLMGRLSSAQPNTGEGFELDAIAAVILGGTSLMGGRGAIWGTLVGAFIIGILNNGFNLMAVDAHFQLVAKGVIILLAVLLDRYIKRSKA